MREEKPIEEDNLDLEKRSKNPWLDPDEVELDSRDKDKKKRWRLVSVLLALLLIIQHKYVQNARSLKEYVDMIYPCTSAF